MARMNIVAITGNLTGEPQFHTFENTGNEKATFQLAWNENRQNKQTQEWEKIPHYFEVECWQGDVHTIRKFKKGDLITVYGRLSWRTWGEGDAKREKAYVTAESLAGDKMYDKLEPGAQGEQSQQPRSRAAGSGSAAASAPRTRAGSTAQSPPSDVPADQPAMNDPMPAEGDADIPW